MWKILSLESGEYLHELAYRGYYSRQYDSILLYFPIKDASYCKSIYLPAHAVRYNKLFTARTKYLAKVALKEYLNKLCNYKHIYYSSKYIEYYEIVNA